MSYELVSALRVRGLKENMHEGLKDDLVCPARAGVEGWSRSKSAKPKSLPCACGG